MASDQSKAASAASGKAASDKPAKSSPKPSKPSKAAPAKPNIFERVAKYFRDVRVEMRRVVWPDREEVVQSSIVVVVALVFFIGYVLIWDVASEWVFISLPIQLFGGK